MVLKINGPVTVHGMIKLLLIVSTFRQSFLENCIFFLKKEQLVLILEFWDA